MGKKDQPNTLTPKLRFPEFRDGTGWEGVPLESLAKRVTTRNDDGSVTRVLTNSAEQGVLDQRDYFERDIVTPGGIDNYFIVERGDYVYNPRKSAIAPMGPISRNNLDTGVMSPLYTVFRFNADETDFYEHYFKSTGWHDFLRNASSMGARHDRMSISASEFMRMPVPRPSPAEQRKIAACLTSMDELLAAEGRKLEALRAHKKGLMQQLFPRPGESRPRLRFPDFRDAGEWKEKRLDEIADFQSGGTPSKGNTAFWNGSIPWVSAKDMKRMVLDDTEDHISDAAVEDGARVVPVGTVLMLTRGMTLLKDVPICLVARPMALNQDVRALRPSNGFDGHFLAYMLVGNKQRIRSMVDIAGHGTGRLNTDRLKALDLLFPEPAEQQRIAACLSSLDALIAAQSRKLDGLRAHKKGLMQQLFPSPEGE